MASDKQVENRKQGEEGGGGSHPESRPVRAHNVDKKR